MTPIINLPHILLSCAKLVSSECFDAVD